MNDREKVIKGLELCKESWECKKECPYYGETSDCNMYSDAIALLKKQEWHVFHKRALTEDEQKKHPDWCFIMEVDTTPNHGEVFLWYRKCSGDLSFSTWNDDLFAEYCDTGELETIEDGDAWLKVPEPPKEDESE